MISTGKVIGFYTDVFGDEIYEYEQRARYTVSYEGYLFYGDSEGYNSVDVDNWDDAIAMYHAYGDMLEIHDNKYDVTFSHGEWR